eukprot:6192056-Pleurochrysis_carterae.AAC.3
MRARIYCALINTLLYGTIFGRCVFRHWLVLSSGKLHLHLGCAHKGRHVGSHGHFKDQLALQSFLASTAGIMLLEARLMTCTSRWESSQRLNYILSLFSRNELRRNPLLTEQVLRRELGGAGLNYNKSGKIFLRKDASSSR